jgi:hypothetical protein
MSSEKKAARQRFRDDVFRRAGYRCQGPGCGLKSSPASAVEDLDAHHITNRNELPAGGYVAENGIALCRRPRGCHERAEAVLQGALDADFAPENLYRIIGSSREEAERASRRLDEGRY